MSPLRPPIAFITTKYSAVGNGTERRRYLMGRDRRIVSISNGVAASMRSISVRLFEWRISSIRECCRILNSVRNPRFKRELASRLEESRQVVTIDVDDRVDVFRRTRST